MRQHNFLGDHAGTIPIVTLELTGMQHMVKKVIMQKQAEMDEQVQRALDAACTEENLQRVIGEAVQQELQAALQSSIKDYFRFGEGRQTVVAAVDAALKLAMADNVSEVKKRHATKQQT